MIETIKSLILDFQEARLETGVPRRLCIEVVPAWRFLLNVDNSPARLGSWRGEGTASSSSAPSALRRDRRIVTFW